MFSLSTIKPLIGLLGLREKVIDWNTIIEDEGFFQLDKEGRKSRIRAPPVDHDHKTGFIRGILSEKLNLLLSLKFKLTP